MLTKYSTDVCHGVGYGKPGILADLWRDRAFSIFSTITVLRWLSCQGRLITCEAAPAVGARFGPDALFLLRTCQDANVFIKNRRTNCACDKPGSKILTFWKKVCVVFVKDYNNRHIKLDAVRVSWHCFLDDAIINKQTNDQNMQIWPAQWYFDEYFSEICMKI